MAAAKKRGTNGARPKTIKLDKIRLDGDTQSRKELDEDVIKEYSDLLKDGVEFPPLEVMFDGSDYWLWDGFHRRWGAVKAGLKEFKCKVTEGTREDARWASYSANQGHGLQRSVEDKQKAVIAALKHPRGSKLSDHKIAEHVGVSQPMVGKYRAQLAATDKDYQSTEREGRDGRVTETARIGSAQTAAAAMRKEAMARAAESGTKPPTQSQAEDSREAKDDDGELINEHVKDFVEECEKVTSAMMFKECLEHVRQAILLVDKISTSLGGTPSKRCRRHEYSMSGLDTAFKELTEWKKVSKC